ncbi:MAG: hypothetical protein IPL61_31100 [Myxococcales bacterium]|nr:hypothetical protein [Myxococcales bacterium]
MIPRARLACSALRLLAARSPRPTADTCPEAETCASDGFCHAADDLALCGAVDAALDDAVALDGARDASDLDASDPDGGGGDGGPVDGGPIDGAGPDGGVIIGQAVAVAAAADHTCAIDDAATLWCWGRNLDGEVGDGSGLARVATPQQVATGVTAVATGPRHSCAIASGRVVCWGRNLDGESGQPLVGAVSTPAEVTGAGTGWVAIAVGDHHSCGIKQLAAQELRAYCWGWDARGARGNGATVVNGPSLTEVAGGLTTWDPRVRGGGYCWGDNPAASSAWATGRSRPAHAGPAAKPVRQYEVSPRRHDVRRRPTAGATTAAAVRRHQRVTSAPHAVARWQQLDPDPVAASMAAGAGRRPCAGAAAAGAIGDGAFFPRAVVGLTASLGRGRRRPVAVAAGRPGLGRRPRRWRRRQRRCTRRPRSRHAGWVDVRPRRPTARPRRRDPHRVWCWGANDAPGHPPRRCATIRAGEVPRPGGRPHRAQGRAARPPRPCRALAARPRRWPTPSWGDPSLAPPPPPPPPPARAARAAATTPAPPRGPHHPAAQRPGRRGAKPAGPVAVLLP